MRRKAKITDASRALASVPLFGACTPEELTRVHDLAIESAVAAGQVLCTEGAVGRELLVLLDGEASVETSSGASSIVGPGDFVGELALIDQGARAATVTMRTDGTVLVVSGPDFRRLLDEIPRIAVGMLPILVSRLRAASAPKG